jgi:hypothetical protein
VVSGLQRINQGRRGDTVTHWHTRFLFTGGGSGLKAASGTTLYTTEADYAQNWISTRSWDAGSGVVAVGQVARKGVLDGNVWLNRGSGYLRVHVDNMTKPYRITLRDLRGREAFRKSDIPGANRVTEIVAPSSAQAVYTLEVRTQDDAYSKVVTF